VFVDLRSTKNFTLIVIRCGSIDMLEITVAYYLGIDGGGSKTTCAVGDEHIVLASSTAGPSNITRVGEKLARESIHHAIDWACKSAKIDPAEIKCACIGAAGAARKDVALALRKFIGESIEGEIEVIGDMAIALEAAFGDKPGVIVNAGTGSIAYGRSSRGETVRAGGWGFVVGDEGSAHWIGREAVAQLLRALDEQGGSGFASKGMGLADFMSPTLFRALKDVWNVNSIEQLVRVANSGPDFSALFPAISTAADEGDELARGIVANAATELSRLAAIVIHQVSAEKSKALPLAMVGGVFRHSKIVRQRFCEEVHKAHPEASLNSGIVEPVNGALQMARKHET
jgi:glucosamine kinase